MLLVKVLALRVIMYQKVILGVVIDFSFLEVSMETVSSQKHIFSECVRTLTKYCHKNVYYHPYRKQ